LKVRPGFRCRSIRATPLLLVREDVARTAAKVA